MKRRLALLALLALLAFPALPASAGAAVKIGNSSAPIFGDQTGGYKDGG